MRKFLCIAAIVVAVPAMAAPKPQPPKPPTLGSLLSSGFDIKGVITLPSKDQAILVQRAPQAYMCIIDRTFDPSTDDQWLVLAKCTTIADGYDNYGFSNEPQYTGTTDTGVGETKAPAKPK